jgi:SAM-dependent methyltransferase
VLTPLRRALTGAPGLRLADIGGGTGNYAHALRGEGWQPLVIDRSPEMLAHAAGKGLETVLADACDLPLPDGSYDAAMLVSMLHHLDSPDRALAEARRILRPGGRLAVMVFTREDISDAWAVDYFPSSRSWMHATHPPLEELLAELPGARRLPVRYDDIADGAMAALLSRPELLLEPRRREQMSFFERLARDHPDELAAGLSRLAEEVREGRAPTRPGRASVVAWVKPSHGGER